MATTCSDLIDQTLDRYLLASRDDMVNVLSANIDSDDTTLTFDYSLDSIAAGTSICVGLEVMRVLATNTTSRTATVLRAQRGSTAAAHTAGDVVQVTPRFSKWAVFNALNDELDSLSGEGLFQMKTVDLTYSAQIMGYDLTSVTSVEDIYSVRYKVPGSSKEWPLIEPSKYRFDRKANTTDFASGFSLVIYSGGYPGNTVRVAYKAPFTRFSALTSDAQTDAGLAATMNRLLPIGAAIALIAGDESGRVAHSWQPDTRRPDEVPAGASLQVASSWRRLRDEWLNAERARLSKHYPMRRG